MREMVLSVVALLAFTGFIRCSDLGKDGFNYYKDHLRGRADDNFEDIVPEEKLYFFRTPVQFYPGLLPALEQEYRKRTGNVFKNHMLNKEMLPDGQPLHKRSSKTALSQMMQGKHLPYPTNADSVVGDDVEIILN